jgi:hypothetical protein
VQPLGSPSEVPLLSHRDEVTKLAQFHSSIRIIYQYKVHKYIGLIDRIALRCRVIEGTIVRPAGEEGVSGAEAK